MFSEQSLNGPRDDHTSQKQKNSLAVQWLELHAFTDEVPDLISGQRTKIPQLAQPRKREER